MYATVVASWHTPKESL